MHPVKSVFELKDEKALAILSKSLDGEILKRDELTYLAGLRGVSENLALFHVARRICKHHFGDRVFLYGFIYFSTYCRNRCSFCFYRKPNIKSPRYRKSLSEILEAIGELEKSGAHLVDLTMGEDPLIHEEKQYYRLIDMCKEIKGEFDMPLMVSPGVLPRKVLLELSRLGVDWYALYQETYNRLLFSRLRLYQNYNARVVAKGNALKEGLLVEDGILIGVGETVQDVVDSIFKMNRIGYQQVRVMGFIPQTGTPMENVPSPPLLDEMKYIALMRLINQDKIIPASYDIDGLKGLELRLMAGANAVTSLIPSTFGLVGVAQATLNIEDSLRTVAGVKPYLEKLGLKPADRQTYRAWVEKEKVSLHKR